MRHFRTTVLIVAAACIFGCGARQPSHEMPTRTPLHVSVTGGSATWVGAETRWSVPVTVTFENRGSKTFQLDKVTGCENGQVSNDVFEVLVDGKPVGYQGIMRKRAHPGPDGFRKIAAGEQHVVDVDLGPHYGFDKKGGTALIRFRHFNHFSKDAVELESEQSTVELRR